MLRDKERGIMKKNVKKIVTFGEIMMRLNPEGYRRFLQADGFEASYAGGEANVAVSLSNYGMNASFRLSLFIEPPGWNLPFHQSSF